MNRKAVDRDHEAQRAAWAAGWFLSLLKARRNWDGAREADAREGLRALGITVTFDEDVVEPSANAGGPDVH